MQIFAKLKRRVNQGPGEHSVYSILKTGAIVSSSKESSNCYIFFQINLPMKIYPYFDLTNKVQNITAFPVFWIEASVDLDNEGAKMLKDTFDKPIQIVNGLALWLGMVLGTLLFIAGIYVIAKVPKTEQEITKITLKNVNFQNKKYGFAHI